MSLRNTFGNRFGLITLGFILAFGAAGWFALRTGKAPADQPRAVSIAIGTWAGFGDAIVGHDANLFPGLDVKITVQDDPTVLSAGLGKTFMVVQSSMDYASQMLANGVKGKILLVTDESSGGDAIIADPTISSISDLVGKRVAYTAGPASEYLLVGALSKIGKKLTDVKVRVFNDPVAARNAYIKREVDVLVIWEPFIEQATQGRKSNVILTSAQMPERVFGVLIASPEMLQDHDLTDRFLRGWVAADEYRVRHPDESAQMISKLLQVSPEDTALMLKRTKIASAARNREFLISKDVGQAPKLETLMNEALAYWKAKGEVGKDARLDHPIAPQATDFFQTK